MKNHIWSDGRLLQTNKKWSALKQSQRTWIQEIIREEHDAYVKEYVRLPLEKRKIDVINRIYARIEERGIWIPYGEFRIHVNKVIDKLNRNSPIYATPATAGRKE